MFTYEKLLLKHSKELKTTQEKKMRKKSHHDLSKKSNKRLKSQFNEYHLARFILIIFGKSTKSHASRKTNVCVCLAQKLNSNINC